jgi:hypothetical protein
MTESMAVTRTDDGGFFAAKVAEAKARNAMVTAIRGTMWSKDLGEAQMRSVAEYCHRNGLDPVRHIEVLGGRIYLNAAFYEERAAPLVLSGELVPEEPDYINADARLDALAATGDAWAVEESTRRVRLRIKHAVPEKAAAAVLFRIVVAKTGQSVVGVNWCGNGVRPRDPVGDAEPTKTAVTRAARRAWKQVAQVVPSFGEQLQAIEARDADVNEEMVKRIAAPAAPRDGFTLSVDYSEADIAREPVNAAEISVTEVTDEHRRRTAPAAKAGAAIPDPYEDAA